MIKLKQIIKYPIVELPDGTQSRPTIEATWVEITAETTQDEEGNEIAIEKETTIKCVAYDASQIDMLMADALVMGTSLEEYQELIAEVEAAYTPPTQEELDAIAEEQTNIAAKEQRAAAMLEGDIYPLAGVDYRVSFTKDDGDGLMQVKSAFELGLASTII